jgi:hypothetical protein
MSHLLPCFFLSTFSTFTMSQWLVDQTPSTEQEMEWGTTLSGSLFQTFTAPFASLHQGVAQVACYDSSVVCIVHILITYDKDQFQSKTYSQQSSEGYWVLICRELATSKVHAFILLNLVSFRNMGSNKIHILYELGTNKINILFELGTQNILNIWRIFRTEILSNPNFWINQNTYISNSLMRW